MKNFLDDINKLIKDKSLLLGIILVFSIPFINIRILPNLYLKYSEHKIEAQAKEFVFNILETNDDLLMEISKDQAEYFIEDFCGVYLEFVEKETLDRAVKVFYEINQNLNFAFFEPIIFMGFVVFLWEKNLDINNFAILFLLLIYVIFVYIRAYIGYKALFLDIEESPFKFFLLFRRLCFTFGLTAEIPQDVIERIGKKQAEKNFYKLVPMILIAVINIFVVLFWWLEIKKMF